MNELWLIVSSVPWWYWVFATVVVVMLGLWLSDYYVSKISFRSEKLKRVAQVMAGFGFWSSTSWAFDNLAYPGMIAWKGLVLGGFIMSAIAILITALFLIFYEYKKVDWMGMDALRSVRDNGNEWIQKFNGSRYRNPFARYFVYVLMYVPVLFFRIALWMLNKGDALAFIGLSLISDPFVTTIYLRHGKFDGLKKKDWGIFLASGALSNFYWTLRSYGVVVVIRYFVGFF